MMHSSTTSKSATPFGENHVNSPTTPTSPGDEETASVLSCPPSKQPNAANDTSTTASFQDGSAKKSRSLDSSVFAVMAGMFQSNNNDDDDDDDDSKENLQQPPPPSFGIPSGITTNADEPNNVSVITIENPFDQHQHKSSPSAAAATTDSSSSLSATAVHQVTEQIREEIEVETVTNESLLQEEDEANEQGKPAEEAKEDDDQNRQNPFDQLLEDTVEESPEEDSTAQDGKASEENGEGALVPIANAADEAEKEQANAVTVETAIEATINETNDGTKELTIESVDATNTPRAHYLRAVQQTAAKCKTMVTTPREIVTGNNPTPKSSVSAQLKRVMSGNDCQAESPDGTVQWIRTTKDEEQQHESPKRPQAWHDPEHRSAFDIALKPQADTPDAKSAGTGAFTVGAAPTSAFHTFQTIAEQQDDNHSLSKAASSSDELSVKEEVLDGTDSSYLQLDVESVASMHTFDIDEETKDKSSQATTMESLRSSLAMIWNTTTTSSKQTKGSHKDHVKNEHTGTKDEEMASSNSNSNKSAPDATNAISTMESLRSSLSMIWNSKPKPKPAAQSSTNTKDTEDVELAKVNHKSKSLQHKGQSARRLSTTSRSRMHSEDSLGSRQHVNLPMGSQYLERGRSPAREKTTTPIPDGDTPDVDDIMECNGSHRSSSYDSMEDFWASMRRTPGQSKNVNVAFYVSSPKSASSPKSIKPVSTSETEDSFIKAAVNAPNTDNVIVTYNKGAAKPETRAWQPPEQEKEQDTMIRAILERPDLVDKSDKEDSQSPKWDCARIRKCVLISLAIFVAIVATTGCLVCGITGKCTSRDDMDSADIVTNPDDQVVPLSLDLPEFTKDSLRSYHTSQAKAYLWLENDPNRFDYTEPRKIQRFALATLYFSTKIAQNWTQSSSWLDYDTHECLWFSHHEDLDVCDEDDEYKRLVLPKNNLRGNLPPELALLTSLVEIDLSRNVLFGPIPEQLGLLTSLEKLWLEKNELNGRVPWSEIGDMTKLRNMSLATNDLKGSISTEVGRLTNLQSLRLFYNFLTGSLPTEVGLLTNLELFDVDVNHLTGTVPSEIGQLTNLNELWMDWNSFVGPLPTTLGLLANVEKLYFGRMFVDSVLRDEGWLGSGDYSIPSELGQLTNLRELYMDNNDLTGLIPVELSALTALETATFDHNLLTDSIAPGICGLFEGELNSLSVDCAEVLCTCGCTCVMN